jgi:hypothetical protein
MTNQNSCTSKTHQHNYTFSPTKYLLNWDTCAFRTITPVSGFANCTVTSVRNFAINNGSDHLFSIFADRCNALESEGAASLALNLPPGNLSPSLRRCSVRPLCLGPSSISPKLLPKNPYSPEDLSLIPHQQFPLQSQGKINFPTKA